MDLKALLTSKGPRARFFVDGVLNKHWKRGKQGMCNDPTDPTDPAQERSYGFEDLRNGPASRKVQL